MFFIPFILLSTIGIGFILPNMIWCWVDNVNVYHLSDPHDFNSVIFIVSFAPVIKWGHGQLWFVLDHSLIFYMGQQLAVKAIASRSGKTNGFHWTLESRVPDFSLATQTLTFWPGHFMTNREQKKHTAKNAEVASFCVIFQEFLNCSEFHKRSFGSFIKVKSP